MTASEDDLSGVLEEFVLAFNDLDLDRFLALWAPEASVVFPFPTVPRRVSGRAAVEAGWRAVFDGLRSQSDHDSPPYLDLRPRDVETVVLADATAAVVTFHLDQRDGGVGRRTLVLTSAGGDWRIVHLHASNIGGAA